MGTFNCWSAVSGWRFMVGSLWKYQYNNQPCSENVQTDLCLPSCILNRNRDETYSHFFYSKRIVYWLKSLWLMYVIFRIRCFVFQFRMLSVLHIHLVNLTSKSKYANINNACIISEYINLSALGYDGSDTLL